MRKEKRFSKLLIRQAETLLAKDAGEERNLGSIQDKIVAQLIFFLRVYSILSREVLRRPGIDGTTEKSYSFPLPKAKSENSYYLYYGHQITVDYSS